MTQRNLIVDPLTMLQYVERWMSGYGTKTQNEIREEVRAVLAANRLTPSENCRTLVLQIPVTAAAAVSASAVRDTIQRFVDIGSQDAADTLENGEGDLEAAQLAADLSFGPVSVVGSVAQGRASNPVQIETGCDEESQLSSFQNGTLQNFGDRLAVTVQTKICVPADLSECSEEQAQAFLRETLETASAATGNILTFDVQIGSNGQREDNV
ncbi:hypothetical protein A9R05_44775 (plasmid) [Burkholderia sp. KK1]|uniref:Uncharacterized protein n=1 Tax=Burkholderia sp. M701 TaxID=326454 RepID=V5YNY3_9BURK|nr:hypothetical protein [Burkholderia sp. M701]AQH06055.1 hypothetical protein A9R05_44775 [Burkholderia sp. KK1]BAO19300.1 hypothetical protein [Burkholderia sp. M701]